VPGGKSSGGVVGEGGRVRDRDEGGGGRLSNERKKLARSVKEKKKVSLVLQGEQSSGTFIAWGSYGGGE